MVLGGSRLRVPSSQPQFRLPTFLLREDVPRNKNIRIVAADEQGTPYILYMKSLTRSDTVVTIKMDLKDFDESIFERSAAVCRNWAEFLCPHPLNRDCCWGPQWSR